MNAQDMHAIAALDLEPIKVKLMHKESGEGWTLERANAVEFEYRRFLYLMKKFPNEQTAPLVDVDIFWHYHILDTLKYAVDCDAVFGYFLHHFPYIGLRGEDDEAAHIRVGLRMKELYEATFAEDYVRASAAGKASDTAHSGVATADVAHSGVAAGAIAHSGVAAQTAHSGVAAGVVADAGVAAQTAHSGVAARRFAHSGVAAGAIAHSGVAAAVMADAGVAAQTAHSGVAAGMFAHSGVAAGAMADAGVAAQMAHSGVAAQGVAHSGVAGASAAEADAAIIAARQSSFYTLRPRLAQSA